MIKHIKKNPKVSLCRECSGTGSIIDNSGIAAVCPQCEGHGRVVISGSMTINIEAYKPDKNHR